MKTDAGCSECRSPCPTEIKPHEMVQAFIPLYFFDRTGGWRRLSFRQLPAHRPLASEPGAVYRGDPARGLLLQPGGRLHLPARAVRYTRGRDGVAVRVQHIAEHNLLRRADLRPARPAGQIRFGAVPGEHSAQPHLFPFEQQLLGGGDRGRLCGNPRAL